MRPLLVLFALAFDGGAVGVAPDAGKPSRWLDNPLARPVDEARVDRVLASLDTRKRAAQLLLAYPQVGQGPVEVGGVVFVGGSLRNIAKAKARIESLTGRARIPPFLAVDMEGGASNRMKSIADLRQLPSARQMASLSDAEVERWGRRVGEAMRKVGLNMNLAPVLDVAGSGHMAQNERSFSGDPQLVVEKATSYARGLLAAGVVPIGKHFPGYGDLAGDSDHALVRSEWSRERISAEVDVFLQTREFLGGVMLANVVYSAYGQRPAILTSELVELAHQGSWISVTDDVSIQLLADSIGQDGEAVLREAFLAGNDLLLTTAPPDWDRGLDYVGILTRLAESDDLARLRLDGACRRVLRLKDRLGLLDGL